MSSFLHPVFAPHDIEPGTLILSTRRLLSVAVIPGRERPSPTEQGKADLFKVAAKLTFAEFWIVKKHANRILPPGEAQSLTLKGLQKHDAKVQNILLKAVLAGIRTETSFANDGREIATCNLFVNEHMHRFRRSCVPNAHVALVQGEWRMEVRTMRKIREGEEIVFFEERPFCRKSERQEKAGAEGCGCVVCRPPLVKKETNHTEEIPDEALYEELGYRFQVVDAFRPKFFANSPQKDFASEDYTAVLEACEWIVAQTNRHNLVHACLAEVFESAYLARTSEATHIQHGLRGVPRTAFDDKLSEMTVLAHCVGIDHEEAQRAILEAWVLAWTRESGNENYTKIGWRSAFEEAGVTCGFLCEGWETFKILPFGEDDADAADGFATKLAEMRLLVRRNGIEDGGARRVIGEACRLASRSRGKRARFERECMRLRFFVNVVQGGRGIRILPLAVAREGLAVEAEDVVEKKSQDSEEGWEDESEGDDEDEQEGSGGETGEGDEVIEVSEAFTGLLKAVERG